MKRETVPNYLLFLFYFIITEQLSNFNNIQNITSLSLYIRGFDVNQDGSILAIQFNDDANIMKFNNGIY